MHIPLFQRLIPSTSPSPCKIPYNNPNASSLIIDAVVDHMRTRSPQQHITVVCIGTDRSTGDCLGPLVGTNLSKLASPHYVTLGTLSQPVHAMNLQETLQQIEHDYPNSFVIAIDACLGQSSSIGQIQVLSGPVKPGAGVNKQLPPVGDMHITGIVNIGGFMEYFVLQNTRLHLVMEMSEIIAYALHSSIIQVKSAAY